jgi:hypothetical protein
MSDSDDNVGVEAATYLNTPITEVEAQVLGVELNRVEQILQENGLSLKEIGMNAGWVAAALATDNQLFEDPAAYTDFFRSSRAMTDLVSNREEILTDIEEAKKQLQQHEDTQKEKRKKEEEHDQEASRAQEDNSNAFGEVRDRLNNLSGFLRNVGHFLMGNRDEMASGSLALSDKDTQRLLADYNQATPAKGAVDTDYALAAATLSIPATTAVMRLPAYVRESLTKPLERLVAEVDDRFGSLVTYDGSPRDVQSGVAQSNNWQELVAEENQQHSLSPPSKSLFAGG